MWHNFGENQLNNSEILSKNLQPTPQSKLTQKFYLIPYEYVLLFCILRTTEGDVFVSYVVDLENSFSETMANLTESFESTLKMKDYKVHCLDCKYVMEITQKSTSFSGKWIVFRVILTNLENQLQCTAQFVPNALKQLFCLVLIVFITAEGMSCIHIKR